MDTLKLLTLDSSNNNTYYPQDLSVSQTLVLLPKIFSALDIDTLDYTCSCCKKEFTMIHPKTKLNKSLLKSLSKFGLDSLFVRTCMNIKTCLLPAFGYKDFDDNDVYTFYTYNVLNTIVGTELEPHKDITMCRLCMIEKFNKEVEDLPLEGILSPSSTLIYKHLKDYTGSLNIKTTNEYCEHVYEEEE